MIELLLCCIYIIDQLVFPGKNRKGNLLSGLFIFCSGLIERAGHLEYNGFSVCTVTEQKLVRSLLLGCCQFFVFLTQL